MSQQIKLFPPPTVTLYIKYSRCFIFSRSKKTSLLIFRCIVTSIFQFLNALLLKPFHTCPESCILFSTNVFKVIRSNKVITDSQKIVNCEVVEVYIVEQYYRCSSLRFNRSISMQLMH
jgi:hypothetical protein